MIDEAERDRIHAMLGTSREGDALRQAAEFDTATAAREARAALPQARIDEVIAATAGDAEPVVPGSEAEALMWMGAHYVPMPGGPLATAYADKAAAEATETAAARAWRDYLARLN